MTNKHKIYYFYWRILLFLQGIRKGSHVKFFSKDKDRFIYGLVTGFTGDSISDKSYTFDIQVHFLEPLQGNDIRYYSSGAYSREQFITLHNNEFQIFEK